MFVTEPVFCSLANVLGEYENLPSPLPLCIKVCLSVCLCMRVRAFVRLHICVCMHMCAGGRIGIRKMYVFCGCFYEEPI